MADNFDPTKFNTDIGQKATVKRERYGGEAVTEGNLKLRNLGELLHPVDNADTSVKYQGSCAVHIYQSEILKEIFIITQVTTLGETNEELAGKAITDLRNECMEFYGRRAQRKRSGF